MAEFLENLGISFDVSMKERQFAASAVALSSTKSLEGMLREENEIFFFFFACIKQLEQNLKRTGTCSSGILGM